eukprot:8182606-Pyramimonas_sp.AAC.1
MRCRTTSPAAHLLLPHSAPGTHSSAVNPVGGNVQASVEQARTVNQLTSNPVVWHLVLVRMHVEGVAGNCADASEQAHSNWGVPLCAAAVVSPCLEE